VAIQAPHPVDTHQQVIKYQQVILQEVIPALFLVHLALTLAHPLPVIPVPPRAAILAHILVLLAHILAHILVIPGHILVLPAAFLLATLALPAAFLLATLALLAVLLLGTQVLPVGFLLAIPVLPAVFLLAILVLPVGFLLAILVLPAVLLPVHTQAILPLAHQQAAILALQDIEQILSSLQAEVRG